MSSPEDIAFNQHVHETLRPVGERYVEESGHPDQTFVADFDPGEPMLDYLNTHIEATPLRPRLIERAGIIMADKLMGIPPDVLHYITAAMKFRAAEIIDHRMERPLVHLADHTPNLLPVATQFAGNIALARRLETGTEGGRLAALIRRSHGIGTVGYRPFGVRPVPHGPGMLIGKPARTLTNTHYSVPPTPQYRDLDWQEGAVERLNTALAVNLVQAVQDPKEAAPVHGFNPLSLKPEIVINPPGTKPVEEDGKLVIPKASKGVGMLVDALGADILEVYTAFEFDERGKITDAYCEVGEVREVDPGGGVEAIRAYMQRLAEFRSEHEDRAVIYAGAA